ncbi:SOS response-associated peptidase [Paenibacillus sp. MMS18-CY102]|uniref:SOS response-associated peptidase n=1 Tax=Paenibacillus sp. MMS18-CY102 TaxID=2682849 RepID=UPI001924B3A5|nr:SOS response-associated peptidase [Paenibacillus sp. MMS18-CY102]
MRVERFALKSDIHDVVGQFKVWNVRSCLANRFNIAPTQRVSIVMNDRHRYRMVDEARWGLFPFWAKDSINADGERIGSKSHFYRMLKSRRCIVPSTGFYGWKQEGLERDPRAMHIIVERRPLFGMAGIYDSWINPQGKEERAFTILTVPSSGPMAAWQQRLPVVLDEEGIERWMNPEVTDFAELRTYIQPLEPFQLRSFPVTNAVSDVKYEQPDCVMELKFGSV